MEEFYINSSKEKHEHDVIVSLMCDEIREELHDKYCDEITEQQFIDLYCLAHAVKYKSEFTIN